MTALSSTDSQESGTVRSADRKLMIAIVTGPFLGNLIMLAPPPFFPLISAELGISVPLLGQVMTGMLLLSAILALIIGPLADRYGHRRIMMIGSVAAAASLVAFGLAQSYTLLILAGLIGGLATASLPSIGVAVASSVFTGANRRRALGWTSSAGAGSAVIGVPLLVVIADQFGWRVSLATAGVLALGGLWVIRQAVPGANGRASGRTSFSMFRASYQPLIRDRQSVKVLIATVLRTICWSGYLTYLGALMHQELGLSTRQIGLMFLVGGGAYIAASLNARRVLSRMRLRLAVALGNGSMALLVGLVMSGVPGFWLTLVLIPLTAVAAGIGWVSIVTLMAEESPAEPGTTMALNGSAFNLGAAGGGGLGGLLLATGGFPAVGLAAMVVAMSAAVLLLIPARRAIPVPSAGTAG